MAVDAATITTIARAVEAVGPHDPDCDWKLDLDAHARELKDEAAGLREILRKDPTVRQLQSEYRKFNTLAVNLRAKFELWISAICLIAVAAICFAMFLIAIPGETADPVRWLLAAALAMVAVTFFSLMAPLKWVFDKVRKTAWGWWGVWLGLVALVTYGLFQYGIPDSFDTLKGPALNTLAAVFLVCAGFADFVSGGLTAKLLKRKRSMFQDWQDARGRAEANRRALFAAVLSAPRPDGIGAGAVSLLSQKLEYFRRYQIGVQQSYYGSKSKENRKVLELADIARTVAFGAFSALFIGAGLGWASRYSEQGGGLVPDCVTAFLIDKSLRGWDDIILLIAMLALGAYAFLQLRVVLLRSHVNHRRFATALGMLQQATSTEPCSVKGLATDCPLTTARRAAAGEVWDAGDDAVKKKVNDKAVADVEAFLRDVNQRLAVEVGDWNNMTSFSIIAVGTPPKLRLFSTDRLDATTDFERIIDDHADRGFKMVRARKIAFVSAFKASGPMRFTTRYNGKEGDAVAEAGDWVVTNMDMDRRIIHDDHGFENIYVIKAADFDRLYDPDGGRTAFGEVYKAKGVVDAIKLDGGFDILAPWGERQQGPHGYIVRNGKDVYGIHGDAFDKTYEIVA